MTELVGDPDPGTYPDSDPGESTDGDETGSRSHKAGAGGRANRSRRARRPDRSNSAGRKSGSGRDLRAATTVGLGLAALVLGTLFIWAPAFVAVVVVVMIVAVWELAQALAQRGVTVPVVPVMLGSALMIVGGYIGGPGPLMVGLSLTASAVAVWRLSEHRPGYGRDVVAGIFTAVYIPFMAGFAALMLRDPDDGAWQVFALLAIVVASDTGGFFAGSAIGKHPLAPTVSPKKSWEGLVGSVVLALAVGVLLAAVVFDGPLWAGLLLGAVGVVGGTVGDLGESLIKRDIGIKDMSRLLPGHGGLMDRLDSLLPTAPLLWLVFTYAF